MFSVMTNSSLHQPTVLVLEAVSPSDHSWLLTHLAYLVNIQMFNQHHHRPGRKPTWQNLIPNSPCQSSLSQSSQQPLHPRTQSPCLYSPRRAPSLHCLIDTLSLIQGIHITILRSCVVNMHNCRTVTHLYFYGHGRLRLLERNELLLVASHYSSSCTQVKFILHRPTSTVHWQLFSSWVDV